MAHAGRVGLSLLVERTCLTRELARAMARHSFVPVHDYGQVLSDVAVSRPREREVLPADGGETIGDIDVLRH